MPDRKKSYLIYMHERVRVEIYENHFKVKKERNKAQQNKISAAGQKVPIFCRGRDSFILARVTSRN
jgi:hypothetical protein